VFPGLGEVQMRKIRQRERVTSEVKLYYDQKEF
jgi:hypothetical protein